MKDHKKTLLIASGLSATQFADYDYIGNGWTIVTVNNAWQIPPVFDYWCKPKDFCGPVPTVDPGVQITEKHYDPCLKNHGGKEACYGAGSITLSALYWTLDTLRPRVLGLLGCDMDYTPDAQGRTAFYGKGYDIRKKTRSKGRPDPLYQARRSTNRGDATPEDFLVQLYARFAEHCAKQNTRVVNLSKSPVSLLPYDRADAQSIVL